ASAVHTAASDARPQSYEMLYQALLKTHLERPSHWRIEIPEDGGPIQARSLSAEDMAGRRVAAPIGWLGPRAHQVLRDVQWGHFVSTWIYDLHYRLLLGTAGSVVMGVIGLMVILLMVAGVWVWWPLAWRAIAAAFTFKRHVPLARQIYDIHKLI